MKSKPVIAVVVGLVLLVIGGFMQFRGTTPAANPELTAACRAEMQNRGGDAQLIKQCDDQAFASAITATDAQSAAQSISAANRQEVGGNMISMFMIGLGLALFVLGLIRTATQRKAAA